MRIAKWMGLLNLQMNENKISKILLIQLVLKPTKWDLQSKKLDYLLNVVSIV